MIHIDGTTNFAHGLPIFSVSIGIQKNGETIIGVIYDVMRDVIYSAEKGSGAYENDKKINVNDNGDLARKLAWLPDLLMIGQMNI